MLRSPLSCRSIESEEELAFQPGANASAGFPAGRADGHHLQNRGTDFTIVLEIGTAGAAEQWTEYPDVDLRATPAGYMHKDGTPY